MKPYVITINRGYGSGGRTIGKKLAGELGIAFYDRNLLKLASDDSGISEALFVEADETVKNTLLYKIAKNVYKGEVIPPDKEEFVSNQNLFNYQAKIIKELAVKEPCVIMGRCADYILKDYENVIRIYVHAPMAACIEGVRNVAPWAIKDINDDKSVKNYIQTVDKRRSAYYRYFTGEDWTKADHYDLCLDSSKLGYEKCIELVKAYIEIKLDIKLDTYKE